MRILRIISSMNPKIGGPCEGIRNSIPVLGELGVENEVVCFDSPDSEFLARDHFPVHAIGPAKGPYAFCPGLGAWLRDNLSRFNVVIIHGLWLYNSYGSFRFWKQFKKQHKSVPKIYVMPHGMLDPYFQKTKSRRMKALRNRLFWQLVEKRVINGTDGLLFTCAEELLLARKTFPSYEPKAELNIGYGIQPPPVYNENHKQEFLRRCPKVINREYWLFLSRVHPKKGADLLIKAYLTLKKKYNSLPDLVVAGPGLETAFGQTIQEMGTDDNIHFPGMLLEDAKWGAFYGCETFILPSHQENFGIAVVEALACSKAVLITDQVNIWREIHKGRGGLISTDTEEGISSIMEQWIKTPTEIRNQWGANAAEIYRTNFTVRSAAMKMMESVV